MTTTAVCVKVDCLRENGYDNLRIWMTNPKNKYVGRNGRVSIKGGGLFAYPGSKWANPYKVPEYNLKTSLILYTLNLIKSGLIFDLDELRGYNLGCFCVVQKDPETGVPMCHAQVLADLINNCSKQIRELKTTQGKKMIDESESESEDESEKIQLIPNAYTGKDRVGDFSWMIKQPQYDDVLFIFNDNEESFLKKSCKKGGGNAAIRPYQCADPPRAAGIPTGSNAEGYSELSVVTQKIIDKSLDRIYNLLKTGNYRRVMYSAKSNGELGESIFKIDKDVKEYIVNGLRKVVDKANR